MITRFPIRLGEGNLKMPEIWGSPQEPYKVNFNTLADCNLQGDSKLKEVVKHFHINFGVKVNVEPKDQRLTSIFKYTNTNEQTAKVDVEFKNIKLKKIVRDLDIQSNTASISANLKGDQRLYAWILKAENLDEVKISTQIDLKDKQRLYREAS